MQLIILNLPFGNQRVALDPYEITTIIDNVDCLDPDDKTTIYKTTQINLKVGGDKGTGTYVRVIESIDAVVAACKQAYES